MTARTKFSKQRPTKERQGAKKRPQWIALSELIPPLPQSAASILDNLPGALEQVWPLNRRHSRQLYRDIRDLSAALTSHRAEMKRSYWLSPGFISAYMYYFLPWNLVRLARLLSGLSLQAPQNKSHGAPLLLDCGSGPLTLPIALWLARPDLRELPMHIMATDSIRRPLELGAELFQIIAGQNGAWTILTDQVPFHKAAVKAKHIADRYGLYPWLYSAANMLNELEPHKTRDEDDPEEESAEAIEENILSWRAVIDDRTQILLVEPGTRLGGTTIMKYRQAALRLGLRPLSPCTHDKRCPLLKPDRNGLSQSWCHFVFSAQDAPDWLKTLSHKAGLFKSSLTLSCLLLTSAKPGHTNSGDPLVRIVSRPFTVDEQICRYGCASCGLCLLPDSRSLISGSLTSGIPSASQKDAKSGATILKPESQPAEDIKK